MTNHPAYKTPDHKLIAALRVLALYSNSEEGTLRSVLYEAADRLEELTQPKPIKIGELMPWVICFGGTILDENGFETSNKTGVMATTPDGGNPWPIQFSNCNLISPTHWLPRLQVDMETLTNDN